MSTSLNVSRAHPHKARAGSAARTRVLGCALALVVAQLVFRGWATFAAWYHYDDFNFMSRMANEGFSLQVAMRQYSGHVMPGGMYLSGLADQLAPYDFRVTAGMLLLFQVLADVGLVVALVRLFGVRPGILPPIALYLFSSLAVPVAIWWAAGVNQLPLQAAFFWATASHVAYLRDRRDRDLAQTLAWLTFGFLFYEKTLLVVMALAIVTLCYFARGSLWQRVLHVARHYTAAVVWVGILVAVYLAAYAKFALTFSPSGAKNNVLVEVASNMTFHAYLPSMFGGPLHWWRTDQWSLPTPGNWLMAAALIATVVVVFQINQACSRSLRAWWLPASFLAANILLVVAGRASYVGALISLDFRFQAELSAVTAIALACATMPILGAVEPVVRRGRSPLLDHPERVAAVMTVVSVLGLVSSVQYVNHWNSSAPGKAWFDNLRHDMAHTHGSIDLVDTTLPADVMWGLGYPENTVSHLTRAWSGKLRFVHGATDELNIVDAEGHIRPALVPPTRTALPGPTAGCGYQVTKQTSVDAPLDGAVAYGGWWLRIGYLASDAALLRVEMGDTVRVVKIEPGVHAAYLEAGGQFDSVGLSGLRDGVTLCTDDLTVGRPALAYQKAGS